MSLHSRVLWSQGMFLLPHHFQQEARHVEYEADMRLRATGPHAWGFFELALDEGLLAVGRVGISRAAGLLPDGTPFSVPQHDAPPVPLEIPADMKGEMVLLAVPLAREGVTQVRYDDAGAPDLCRWRATSEELRDHTNAADEPEPVQTGALELRLLRAKEATDAHALLGVARVLERRSDGQVVVDRGYIAPQTRIDASQQLSAHASLLHGLVRQRARALAARMGQSSHGVSEMADFLMLQALNRAEPVFRQHALAPTTSPQALHLACLALAGELSTFTGEGRCPAEHPLYRHDDLQATFTPVIADLRRMLSTVLERNAVQIDLAERNHGVRMAVFPDPELARSALFVLAANAQMPAEQLRTRFPAQSKLGPPERLRDLVNLALPGLALRSLPTAPRQLPFHAGFHYFEIDRGGELWKQIERGGSLAMHVAGDFPGLDLELWAIRQ
ncbi:type VI secretion system baseplate subunit TssK [Ramlibacter monticola]|uniref:Type VI secretion system baseplate subunit TssK n=1 Tax=Ramlibacter monticola TaxID=1926872 RepID=A0A936Z3C6_9BURK|nr:type VI secretion system baseplate subunit TssK [Ramlibacter monticola]MBL0392842.1 type VI secretion system baseplate subunit TssK [Ramlibacter monticola]